MASLLCFDFPTSKEVGSPAKAAVLSLTHWPQRMPLPDRFILALRDRERWRLLVRGKANRGETRASPAPPDDVDGIPRLHSTAGEVTRKRLWKAGASSVFELWLGGNLSLAVIGCGRRRLGEGRREGSGWCQSASGGAGGRVSSWYWEWTALCPKPNACTKHSFVF